VTIREWLETKLYEPMSALTHFIALLGAAAGTAVLANAARGELPKMISLLVYGLSMILLFAASTLFHGAITSQRTQYRLNRLDHMAIFLLIAGTYTPIAFNLFPADHRLPTLTFIWGAALLGIGIKMFSRRIHGFLHASIYVVMAWGGAVPLALVSNIIEALPWHGLALLLLGGLIYTSGFVVYYWQWPDPWPGWFGHHEVWHLFVMGGSAAHYLFMLWYVVPFEG